MSLHVTTFYSFKGGVGRTQALANVAAWIALKQRPSLGDRPKVLMVDFDLEASGIQYVEGLNVVESKPGIVDFIHDYLDNAGEVPDVSKYISRATLPGGIPVDLILAGDQRRYHRRFGQLRFDALWQRQHGADLFLDMKNQLDELGYEFMLIDSRTGLCDTSELCTLTLPDQVVVMFAPNRQNLEGTRLVIERIRQNVLTSIIGVASRVRMSDDEHGGLRSVMAEFRGIFKDAPPLVVHEDPQQRVLSNAMAVVSYRRSGLAKEYRRLARRVVANNPRSAFWSLQIVRDASSATRMERRYGISPSALQSWRKTASESCESGDALWAIARSHSDAKELQGDRRILGVSALQGLCSLSHQPPPEAIRWVVAAQEQGELESLAAVGQIREIVDSAIAKAFEDDRLESVRDHAIAYLVWNDLLHQHIAVPAVAGMLRDPASYRDGNCLGGFLGEAVSRYIMGCGTSAGCRWEQLGEAEEARPWIRTAAIHSGLYDIARQLHSPTSIERKSLPDWLRWASDRLAIGAVDGTAGIKQAKAEIGQCSELIEQLRDFWLPGVESDMVNDDDHENPFITRQQVCDARGVRPKLVRPSVLWNASSSAPTDWMIPKRLYDFDTVDYLSLSWFGLLPTASSILELLGHPDLAVELLADAVRRLDFGQLLAYWAKCVATGRIDVIRPIGFALVYSPIHRAPLSISTLIEILRGSSERGAQRGDVIRVSNSPVARIAWPSQIDSRLGQRQWHGWRVSAIW